jgi:hypothetical protein
VPPLPLAIPSDGSEGHQTARGALPASHNPARRERVSPHTRVPERHATADEDESTHGAGRRVPSRARPCCHSPGGRGAAASPHRRPRLPVPIGPSAACPARFPAPRARTIPSPMRPAGVRVRATVRASAPRDPRRPVRPWRWASRPLGRQALGRRVGQRARQTRQARSGRATSVRAYESRLYGGHGAVTPSTARGKVQSGPRGTRPCATRPREEPRAALSASTARWVRTGDAITTRTGPTGACVGNTHQTVAPVAVRTHVPNAADRAGEPDVLAGALVGSTGRRPGSSYRSSCSSAGLSAVRALAPAGARWAAR